MGEAVEVVYCVCGVDRIYADVVRGYLALIAGRL
jgi:hypothetical protein